MTQNQSHILSIVTPILEARTVFALAFGSILGNSFNAESDIDLAVYLSQPPSWDDKMAFRRSFWDVSPYECDIVFLNDADLIISMQALANGRLLVNNDPVVFISYKAGIITQYIDFKISRKIIEEHMLNGRIYA
ncbi:nucleotidyltransferase domain-containing protein [bacterium]|nr:nucleotidyltransferase domain-containing protein [bacterium]